MLPIRREKRKRPWIMQRLALCYYISKYKLFTRLSCDAVSALNTTLIMQYRPTFIARYLHNARLIHFVYIQQVSDQSNCSVSAISYEKNRTCSISDNFCRTTFSVTHAIKIVRYCRTTISYDFYRSSDISFTRSAPLVARSTPDHL